MIQEKGQFLINFANTHNIHELSSEDILKLTMKPYLMVEIAEAFNITEEEFKKVKKEKGISNVILESMIRDIDVILNHIDSKDRYVSNKIRKQIVDILVQGWVTSLPNKNFYLRNISSLEFSREQVARDLLEKEIDQEYRLAKLKGTLLYIDDLVDKLVEQEKHFLLDYNDHQLYNKLYKEKTNGKSYDKNDLTYDFLFELAIVENIPDSMIGDIFNMTKAQVRYFRKKHGMADKHSIKLKAYPEVVIYTAERSGSRPIGMSNLDYDRIIDNEINRRIQKTKTISKRDEDSIEIDGEGTYHIQFSDEKYCPKSPTSHRKSHGTLRNQRQESDVKIKHGKIGEKIAKEAEKKCLVKLGLEDLADQIQLIAQVDDEITLDGLGYDLLSFNEKRERICIEVKTCYGNKDKSFFISEKEIQVMRGLVEEYDCKQCFIYFVLIDNHNVTIKTITPYDLTQLKLTPVLYKVEANVKN